MYVIIDIYGLVIKCQAQSSELIDLLVRPFKEFVKDKGGPSVVITVVEEDPPYNTFPSIKARFSTPRNIVYKNRACKIIDYFGKGVILEDYQNATFTLYGRCKNFLQEAFYLHVVSLFGQHCDRTGMLRVHALALSHEDTAILMLMPPGSGKSTMAIAMLQEEGFKLLSDDQPVVDKHRHLHPFHLTIGTLDKEAIRTIPKEYVYEIDRMEFGLKYFIDCDYWRDRLENRPLKKSILFTSQRLLNSVPSIEKTSKRKVLSSLMRDAVIGVGLYQGVEFIFQSSSWEILSKFRTVLKRFMLALKLTMASKTYQMNLSGDTRQNANVLKEFIQSLEQSHGIDA